MPCEVCHGRRYNREALEVTLREKSIADVLNMTVDQALEFFWNFPKIKSKLETMRDVGLGYIRLGQPATTLSGGEAQRVKLSTELSRQGHRQDPVHPGRAHHRTFLRGLRRPAEGAAPAGERGATRWCSSSITWT